MTDTTPVDNQAGPKFDDHTERMFIRALVDARNQMAGSSAVTDEQYGEATDTAFEIANSLGFDAESDQNIITILEIMAIRFPNAAQTVRKALDPEA